MVSRGQHETAVLLDQLIAYFSRFLILTPEQYTACAVWTMHTYCWQLADCTPYLIVTSAEMRSGKTRLIEALSQVVHRPYMVVSPTEAVLFRVIDSRKPTLLIDETDTMFRDTNSGPSERQEGIRAVINSGFRSSGYVSRLTPQMELADFSTFCPKLLAGIGHLPQTIEDRGLPIRLVRKKVSEEVERFRERTVLEEAKPLRDRLEGWGAYALINLEKSYPEMPEGLDDRAQDMYELLVAIGDFAGEEWGQRVRDAVVTLRSGGTTGEASRGIRLLEDLSLVNFGDYERIPTADLLALLYEHGEQPWEEWWGESGGKKAARRLALVLEEYGVRPGKWRDGGVIRRGYEVAEISAEVTRYAYNTPHTPHMSDLQALPEIATRHTPESLWRVGGDMKQDDLQGNPESVACVAFSGSETPPEKPGPPRGSVEWIALASAQELAEWKKEVLDT